MHERFLPRIWLHSAGFHEPLVLAGPVLFRKIIGLGGGL